MIIAELNDRTRTTFSGARFMLTRGVMDNGLDMAAITAFQAFTDFNKDNDPHGEHDFFFFTVLGHKLFAKCDYYAPDMEHGSDDPADPRKTKRVWTIGLASER